MPHAASAWPHRGLRRLDLWLQRTTQAAALLVLPLAVLLCLQWPLRDAIHAYSREANDMAQLLFGIYVSIAMTAATRSHAHLTPEVLAQHYPARLRQRLLRWASAGLVLPWASFTIYTAAPMVWQSLRQLEAFPDSFTPGYFILKIGVLLLAGLLVLQTIVDLCLPPTAQPTD
jgi:TRAP-type mannitol/chloroaromatic compound transport system permease small subunit